MNKNVKIMALLFLFFYVINNEVIFAKIEIETREYFTSKDKLLSYNENIKPFSFAVIADPHAAEQVKSGYEKFGTAREKFQLCLKEINKRKKTYNPKFVLILGDIHFWAIKDLLADFPLPFHVIAGNHETKKCKKALRDYFSDDFKIKDKESDYYSFLYNKVRFIGICDAMHPDHVGHLSSDAIQPFGQSKWLENELTKKEKIKVIFGHIPPEPNSEDKNMWLSRNDSLFFNDLVKKTNPTIMFFGHQHRPTRELLVSKCKMYIVRSSSWNANNTPIGFLFVSFEKKGILIKEFIFR